MQKNEEIIYKIQERSKKSGTLHIDKFFQNNPQIEEYCKNILLNNPWFQNIKNVFIAIGHNIFDTILCRNCKKPLKVKNAIYGRHFYCSKKCADNSNYTRQLREKTCLEKYGTKTPLLNKECQQKTKKTCQEKYGNDMFAGSKEYKQRVQSPFLKYESHIKSKETKITKYGQDYGKIIFEKNREAVQKRNIDKYGVPYLLMKKDILKKTHISMKEKYGADNYWKSQKCNQQRILRSWKKIQSWSKIVIPLFTFQQYKGQNETIYKWKCVKCGNQFISRIYVTGLGNCRTIPRCDICFPNSSVSIQQKVLLDFIKSIYTGVIQHNKKGIVSNKKELDIYIPQKNIAIQFDGIYWHSQQTKPYDYHLMKTQKCLQKGIQLIHIFQDQWLYKQNIVKDRIKNLLGIYDKRIFARKCIIKQIAYTMCEEFLDENHIQGHDNSKIRIGLFYQNQLVSVMTFSNPRFNKNYQYELVRFASKLGYQVIGGASKLLKYFERKYNPKSLISYADRRYSNGKLYYALGFQFLNNSQPNYLWIKNRQQYTRYQCQKHKLKNILGQNFNQQLSESQNMYLNGFDKIYDCGNMVFIKQYQQLKFNPIIAFQILNKDSVKNLTLNN